MDDPDEHPLSDPDDQSPQNLMNRGVSQPIFTQNQLARGQLNDMNTNNQFIGHTPEKKKITTKTSQVRFRNLMIFRAGLEKVKIS